MQKITRHNDERLNPLGQYGIRFTSLNRNRRMKPGVELKLPDPFTVPPYYIFRSSNSRLNYFIRKSFLDNAMCNTTDLLVNNHLFFRACFKPSDGQALG